MANVQGMGMILVYQEPSGYGLLIVPVCIYYL